MISRQAAIDALMAWEEGSVWDKRRGKPYWVAPSDVIEHLPSAQPEQLTDKEQKRKTEIFMFWKKSKLSKREKEVRSIARTAAQGWTRRKEMTQEQVDNKLQRLINRLDELNDINRKIGKLSFYLNENADGPDGIARDAMIEQLEAMDNYRDRLEYRIEKGWY